MNTTINYTNVILNDLFIISNILVCLFILFWLSIILTFIYIPIKVFFIRSQNKYIYNNNSYY